MNCDFCTAVHISTLPCMHEKMGIYSNITWWAVQLVKRKEKCVEWRNILLICGILQKQIRLQTRCWEAPLSHQVQAVSRKTCMRKERPFLFKNVTSESISQKRTTLHNCQIKHCVVIYWSLTFIYWTRHVSSWTTGSSLTRQKTGNLFLNCADILSIILMRSSDSTVSWRHMTTLCFCLSLAILLLTHQFRWKQKQSCLREIFPKIATLFNLTDCITVIYGKNK